MNETNEYGLSKDKDYQQFEIEEEATSLQKNKEEPLKKEKEEPLKKEKEETLKKDIGETKASTIKTTEKKAKKIKSLINRRKRKIPINNKKKRKIPTQKDLNANLELVVGDNYVENTEDAIPDDYSNIVDQLNKNKEKPKEKHNYKFFETNRQRGPPAKKKNKRHKHASYYNDNMMDKVGRLFINSYRCYLNHRCKKYGKLKKINFVKLYGNGYKRHKRFLKRIMKVALGFRNRNNKKIIHDMIHKEKDVIFIALMKLKVEDAYNNLYKKNYPYLQVKNYERYLSHFISLKKAIKNKKEEKIKKIEKKWEKKDSHSCSWLSTKAMSSFSNAFNQEKRKEKIEKEKKKVDEDLERVEKASEEFIETICKQKKNKGTPKKRIKKCIVKIHY